eukprot:1147050-Pelagomonas_calceolata.AAC.1
MAFCPTAVESSMPTNLISLGGAILVTSYHAKTILLPPAHTMCYADACVCAGPHRGPPQLTT